MEEEILEGILEAETPAETPAGMEEEAMTKAGCKWS
jgi:hypothetical protein